MKLITKIVKAAKQHLPVFLEKHKDVLPSDKSGVYLYGMIVHISGTQFYQEEAEGALIGLLPQDKVAEKMTYAAEKAMRLLIRRVMGYTERTSLFTQSYAAKQYGGAICVLLKENVYCILSCSNFPPFYDTVFAVEVLQLAEVIDEKMVELVMDEALANENNGKL